MTAKILSLPGVDESPASLLERAKEWPIQHCIIIGESETGELIFGGTREDGPEILWLIERAKHELFEKLP